MAAPCVPTASEQGEDLVARLTRPLRWRTVASEPVNPSRGAFLVQTGGMSMNSRADPPETANLNGLWRTILPTEPSRLAAISSMMLASGARVGPYEILS